LAVNGHSFTARSDELVTGYQTMVSRYEKIRAGCQSLVIGYEKMVTDGEKIRADYEKLVVSYQFLFARSGT
jgi:hypothetical protein